MGSRAYQVSDVERMAGVSVRTLHHYDNIGLLVPSSRTSAGYRIYTDDDLLRLQQILIGRELGLSLEDIRRLLDDPAVDRHRLLLRQRDELIERARNTQAMIRSVDAALAIFDGRQTARGSTVDMQQLFNGFDPAEYEKEARERWGETGAYQESARRTGNYSAQDWQKFKAEWDAAMKDAAAALHAQIRPDDPVVMDVAERHRQMIDRWFYPCSPEMHTALAAMYEADERFVRNIDAYATGLTPFWSAAIRANAARLVR